MLISQYLWSLKVFFWLLYLLQNHKMRKILCDMKLENCEIYVCLSKKWSFFSFEKQDFSVLTIICKLHDGDQFNNFIIPWKGCSAATLRGKRNMFLTDNSDFV